MSEISFIEENKIPLKKELLLNGASKAINCLAWDKSGARVLTGSSDHIVRMYDFGGMTAEHSPFHQFCVAEGQSVYCLNYSPIADLIIASTADAKPVVYDKNGNKNITFIKGNPYILDNSKTPGHTNTVCTSCFHPTKVNSCMTASLDGTCRIWDLKGKTSFGELESVQAIRAKSKRGLRVGITSACYNATGNLISLGCDEGGVLMFDDRIRFARATMNNYTTHSDQVVDIRHHPGGQIISTRGRDKVVCLWDIRKFTTPLKTVKDINCFGHGCNVAFSPDAKLMALAVPSDLDGKEPSTIQIFDVFAEKLQPLYTYKFAPGMVAFSLLWHDKLNQMIVGMRDGSVRVLYDNAMSLRGAIMVEGRTATKKKEMTFGNVNATIYAPDSNDDDIKDNRDDPKKRDNRPGKINPYVGIYDQILHSGGTTSWEKSDPIIPETGLPMISGGQGLGFQEAEVMEGIDKVELNMDPRDALIRHENDKKKDIVAEYNASVFKKNMPTPVFTKRTLEADLDEEEQRNRKRTTLNR